MTRRLRVCAQQELRDGRVVPVDLGPTADGRRRQVLVLQDDLGQVQAYLNRCRHLPIPIDGGSGDFTDDSGQYLLCGTHGALYRREDGACVAGPCGGLSLHAAPVELQDGDVYVVDPADSDEAFR